MGVLTLLAVWLGSLFGRDTDTPTAGRAWWLDKGPVSGVHSGRRYSN